MFDVTPAARLAGSCGVLACRATRDVVTACDNAQRRQRRPRRLIQCSGFPATAADRAACSTSAGTAYRRGGDVPLRLGTRTQGTADCPAVVPPGRLPPLLCRRSASPSRLARHDLGRADFFPTMLRLTVISRYCPLLPTGDRALPEAERDGDIITGRSRAFTGFTARVGTAWRRLQVGFTASYSRQRRAAVRLPRKRPDHAQRACTSSVPTGPRRSPGCRETLPARSCDGSSLKSEVESACLTIFTTQSTWAGLDAAS